MNQVLAAGDWSQVDGAGWLFLGVAVLVAVGLLSMLFKRKR